VTYNSNWTNSNHRNGGFSIRELLFSVAILGLVLAVLLPALGRTREAARRSSCAYNLKNIGYSLSLYATESPDQKLPPVQIHIEYPSMSNPYYEGELNEFTYRFRYDFAPSIRAIYVGYSQDPKMLICPSDYENDMRYMDELRCVGFNDSWNEDSRSFAQEGCIADRDDSYKYYGWVFDKGGDERRGDPVTKSTANMEASWFNPFVQPQFNTEGDPDFTVPMQMNATLTAMHHQAWGSSKAEFFKRFSDQIINKRTWEASDSDFNIGSETLIESDVWDPNKFYGNGSTNTVYRLRNGITRFLFTDINNSKEANFTRSTIWVMHEKIGLTPDGFFHTPGGTNVLYLDGHVEFVPLEERAPAMKTNAYFGSQFSNL